MGFTLFSVPRVRNSSLQRVSLVHVWLRVFYWSNVYELEACFLSFWGGVHYRLDSETRFAMSADLQSQRHHREYNINLSTRRVGTRKAPPLLVMKAFVESLCRTCGEIIRVAVFVKCVKYLRALSRMLPFLEFDMLFYWSLLFYCFNYVRLCLLSYFSVNILLLFLLHWMISLLFCEHKSSVFPSIHPIYPLFGFTHPCLSLHYLTCPATSSLSLSLLPHPLCTGWAHSSQHPPSTPSLHSGQPTPTHLSPISTLMTHINSAAGT